MNNVLIAIPSKNRVGVLQKHVMKWVTKQPYDYMVFVEPQDELAYSTVVSPEHLAIMTDRNQGLGHAKACILHYAVIHKYDYIFKVDDDVDSWTGRGKGAKALSVENFKTIVLDCLEAFRVYPDVWGISFPYRNELFEVKKWVGVNSRFQTCYMVRTEAWHADKKISVFEDFANYIYIRSKNRMTLRYGLVGIDCEPVGSGTGGHQDFDRKKKVLEEMKYLKELYPAIVFKKVDRPWLYEPALKGKFFASKKL